MDKKTLMHPDYRKLPEVIQGTITEEEYCWLPDDEKETLIERETIPDEYFD